MLGLCNKDLWVNLFFEFLGKKAFLELELARRGFIPSIRYILKRQGLRFDSETVQVRRLKSLDDHRRAAAITSYSYLRARGDAEAVLVLVHLSQDQCDSVRASVVGGLVSVVERGDRVAIACLVKLLINDTAQIVRETTLLNLAIVGTKVNSEAVVRLLASLANPDTTAARVSALQELGEVAMTGDPIALEGLSLCANNELAKIRETAILTMSRVAERTDGKTASSIVCGFADKDELVRLAAVRAIMPFAFGNITAVVGLRQRVRDDASDSVRAAAISALKQAVSAGDGETIDCIAARLRDTAEKASIREGALRALASLAQAGDGTVFSLITACLEDRSELVRRAATETLVKFAEKGDSCLIEKVVILLNDPDGQVQVAALDALATLSEKGSSKTIKNIATCLTGTRRTEDVCISSARALARVAEPGDGSAINYLLDAICGKQKYQGATCAAVMALAKLVPKGHADAVVINTLCGFLREPETAASRQVIESIMAQCDDKNGKVRAAAVQALADLESEGGI